MRNIGGVFPAVFASTRIPLLLQWTRDTCQTGNSTPLELVVNEADGCKKFANG